ncbi:NrfD/PsrC family molybdoenzyme membrane anchor subunit [Lutibacter flavus]|uniref:Prokaryotic molybdopterin-containing oxidoreductase family, membrane subunit n=1 Tax=Lutibacter flavus TaxID=691689 RepID=A0A238XS06_9FLAO|nr:NrfD/PsrC family molybdoenzyme membrane anchor subunit [Lutibacter flavus]SNR61826.1 prokaryotic molybdopterin-containing oxidoreductase family, membrane subunit [Lutibacter flavus]
MNLENRKRELAKEFSPLLEKTTKTSKIWIGFLIAVILVGVYAFFLQLFKGHIVTGMRDNVVWGIYIINFIFFVCLSYSGAFISGILHFFKTPWKNSISRIVEIITVLSLIIGPIFILLCIGRLDRLHYLFLYPRIQSPITWDIIAIMTDLIGCFIYLFLTFIPDFAILRDNSENAPKWRQKVYKFLAIGYQDTPEQREKLHKVTRTMSAMVIALAIVAYSVLAWIFSLTLQPGWNSSIFAPYFIVAGLYSGVGVIIIAMYLIRKYYNLEHYIRKVHFIGAGIILLVISLLFGYFTFSEYFSRWFSHKIQDANLLNTLFTRYFWMFIFANYIGVLVPIVILFFKKFRTIKSITFAAVIAVVGLWFNKYLIIVPTLETPYLPIQDTRPEFIHYTATWVEWALSFAGVAAFILFFILIMKLVPIIPMSGIIDNERDQKKNKKVYKKIVTE